MVWRERVGTPAGSVGPTGAVCQHGGRGQGRENRAEEVTGTAGGEGRA